MSMIQTIPNQVFSVFDSFTPEQRIALLEVRGLIFEIAGTDPRIGQVEETLRWGEPAYITMRKKTGSTIRLAVEASSQMPALFFNCKTTLVEEFREQFGGLLRYSKNRAVLVDMQDDRVKVALRICIANALTYHLRD